jgi:hypothetical protein
MKTRKLTIERFFGYPHTNPKFPTACLRLKGFWLIASGFQPGDHIEVAEHAEGLLIRKVEPVANRCPRRRLNH